MYRKNVAGQYLTFGLVNATTGAALTGATVSVYRTIDGGAQASATGVVTGLGNGQYSLALSQADTNGNNIGFLFTATNAIPVNIAIVTTSANPYDAVAYGLSALPNAAAAASGGLVINGTNTGAVSLTSLTTNITGNLSGSVGSVTGAVGSVTGNVGGNVVGSVGSISGVTFPTNFSAFSLNASGFVTVVTNNDKTGYSLTQSFPTNFSSLAITVGGAVTVGTNNDKTGYSLSQSFPTNFASLAITAGGAVTVGTNNDKTGYSLAGNVTVGGYATGQDPYTLVMKATMTEGYAANGSAPTMEQMAFMTWSNLASYNVVGTTLTTLKVDHTTTAMTFTLNDATNPTSRVRAT